MWKTILMVVALLVLCTGLAQAQIPAFDPTDSAQVHQLQKCMASVSKLQEISGGGETELDPWRPQPSGDDERDGECWEYQNGNYSQANYCSYSPNLCLDGCLAQQERCANRCATLGGNCSENDSPCETCGDGCRNSFNICKSACGF